MKIFIILSVGILFFANSNFYAQQTDDKTDALMQKVDSLEHIVNNLAKRISALEKDVKGSQAKVEKYKVRANWLALEKGMSPKQVKELLGEPGKILSGFGAFWYYPDSFGGHVEFDDDEKVTGWKEP